MEGYKIENLSEMWFQNNWMKQDIIRLHISLQIDELTNIFIN
jgi:hypothetical protein